MKSKTLLMVGVLLTLVGVVLVCMVWLVVVASPKFKEYLAHVVVDGQPLPTLTRFVLYFSDAVRARAGIFGCVSLVFFVAGLATICRAILRKR